MSNPEVSTASPTLSQPMRDVVLVGPAGVELREEEVSLSQVLFPRLTPQQQARSEAVVQRSAPGPGVATVEGVNFEGLSQMDNTLPQRINHNINNGGPPDTVGAAGQTQYVQWINHSLAVFDKATGEMLLGPIPGNQVFSNMLGPCAIENDGDPIVLYDQVADRWILSQFTATAPPFTQCVAVSTTPDATGTYYLYAFESGSPTVWGDYPKLSIWRDAYYATFMDYNKPEVELGVPPFITEFDLVGPRACAWDRNKMVLGQPADQVCFRLSKDCGYLLAASVDGTPLPPVGSPEYVLSLGANLLHLWKFHVDFATPSNSTLDGPSAIQVAPFENACPEMSACIPQPGTPNTVDALGGRLMFRLAYRNRNGAETLLAVHSVDVGTLASSGRRWYELGFSRGVVSVNQQGTYAPDSNSRWLGSVAMDKVGDVALGYSVSGNELPPSIAYAGRTSSDPRGTLQPEKYIVHGTGSDTSSTRRWGDYSAISIDPVDDCTFWYTNEYFAISSNDNWNTRIASFRFPGCQ